jgi:hypothetical protein
VKCTRQQRLVYSNTDLSKCVADFLFTGDGLPVVNALSTLKSNKSKNTFNLNKLRMGGYEDFYIPKSHTE